MANSSTTGFGLRPIKNVGQTDDNAGLSEWSIAASSALISHHDLCQVTADGVILVSGATDANNIGSLNGAFYTDPTSNKPTWSNYWPASVAASDATALITDNPMQMYEIMSADTSFNQNEVGVAQIAYQQLEQHRCLYLKQRYQQQRPTRWLN